jgi:hypothetical protein
MIHRGIFSRGEGVSLHSINEQMLGIFSALAASSNQPSSHRTLDNTAAQPSLTSTLDAYEAPLLPNFHRYLAAHLSTLRMKLR